MIIIIILLLLLCNSSNQQGWCVVVSMFYVIHVVKRMYMQSYARCIEKYSKVICAPFFDGKLQ